MSPLDPHNELKSVEPLRIAESDVDKPDLEMTDVEMVEMSVELEKKLEDKPEKKSDFVIDESKCNANWKTYGYGLYVEYFYQMAVQKFIMLLNYAFYGQYLNLSGAQFRAAATVPMSAWSLKIFMGVLSDMVPIRGQRRRPYIIIGMTMTFFCFLLASIWRKPQPYYEYDREACTVNKTVIHNPDAQDDAFFYIMVFSAAVFFLAIADVASDALKIEYSQQEPKKTRGTITSVTFMFNACGGILGALLIGIGMNGPAFGGDFCWAIPFRILTGIVALICVLAVLNTFFRIREHHENVKRRNIRKEAWQFFKAFQSREVLQVFVALFIWAVCNRVMSPAGMKVKKNWAKVTPLVSTLTGIVSGFFELGGVFLVKKYFLNASWRKILLVSRLIIIAVDNIVECVTIFDIIRNPYFYFADDLISSIPEGMTHLVAGLIVIEICRPGLEAMFHSLLVTSFVIGMTVGAPISILITLPFGIGSDKTYLAELGGDQPADRMAVFYSFMLTMCVQLLCLPCLLLLPAQKSDVKKLREKKQNYPRLAAAYLIVLCVAFILTLFLTLGVLVPALNCHKIFGGKGC